jgi:hypothetical protein
VARLDLIAAAEEQARVDEPIVIHIQPFDAFLIAYYVYLGPTLLLGPTTTPMRDAARELLFLGYDPERLLFMRRRGVNVNQLVYEIGDAADLNFEWQANPPFLYPLQQDGPGAVP